MQQIIKHANTLPSAKSTIKECRAYYVRKKSAEKISPESLISYDGEIERFSKFLEHGEQTPIDAVGHLDVVDYLEYLQHDKVKWDDHYSNKYCQSKQVGLKSTSVNNSIQYLKCFFNFLQEQEINENNPMKGIKRCQTEVEYNLLEKEEVERLITKLDKEYRKTGKFELFRDTCMIKLMIETGMRANECFQLLPSDVFLEQNVIVLRAAITKTKKKRMVPISDHMAHCLQQMIITQREVEAVNPDMIWLWFTKKGIRFTYDGLSKRLKKYARLADIPENKMHCHNFRHYCVTSRLKKGESETAIQKIMGHIDRKMLEIYTHFSTADLVESNKKFSPLLDITNNPGPKKKEYVFQINLADIPAFVV